MRSLADLNRSLGAVPGSVVMRLSRVDTGRGREELYRNQLPALLTELRWVFVRLQEAWDRGAMAALRAMTTPDMLCPCTVMYD